MRSDRKYICILMKSADDERGSIVWTRKGIFDVDLRFVPEFPPAGGAETD